MVMEFNILTYIQECEIVCCSFRLVACYLINFLHVSLSSFCSLQLYLGHFRIFLLSDSKIHKRWFLTDSMPCWCGAQRMCYECCWLTSLLPLPNESTHLGGCPPNPCKDPSNQFLSSSPISLKFSPKRLFCFVLLSQKLRDQTCFVPSAYWVGEGASGGWECSTQIEHVLSPH